MPPEITCQLNGQAVKTHEGIALSEFVHAQGYVDEGFATAINGEFVPRSMYNSTAVKSGDQIDIVAPVTGG